MNILRNRAFWLGGSVLVWKAIAAAYREKEKIAALQAVREAIDAAKEDGK